TSAHVVKSMCVWEALDVSGRGTAPAKPALCVGVVDEWRRWSTPEWRAGESCLCTTGFWSSGSKAQKSRREQRHGTGCRSEPHQGASGDPSRRRYCSARQVAGTFNAPDRGGRLLV